MQSRGSLNIDSVLLIQNLSQYLNRYLRSIACKSLATIYSGTTGTAKGSPANRWLRRQSLDDRYPHRRCAQRKSGLGAHWTIRGARKRSRAEQMAGRLFLAHLNSSSAAHLADTQSILSRIVDRQTLYHLNFGEQVLESFRDTLSPSLGNSPSAILRAARSQMSLTSLLQSWQRKLRERSKIV